jgi:hypothetical protein
MNDMIQRQQGSKQQLAGVIHSFRQVPTKTGKKMAVFVIDNQPAKCFDLTVDQAQQWAVTGEQVSITGQFSNHNGQTELVAQTISLALSGQSLMRTGFSQGYATSAANQAPIRESSMIVENLSGCVSDMRALKTKSGRAMITFKLDGRNCKAFGDLAAEIQKVEGKEIAISARKGSFQGVTEYAVESLKAIDGTIVNLRDTYKPEPVAAGPTGSISLIDSIQQQIHASVNLTASERKQIAEAIAEPKPRPSEDDDRRSGSVDPEAHGIKAEMVENFKSPPEPARPATIETEQITETPGDPKPNPAAKKASPNGAHVQEWIEGIEKYPSIYTEERLRTLSLKPGANGEAARIVIAKRQSETVTETMKAPTPRPASASKYPNVSDMTQYWLDLIEADPVLYPEETLKQLSLESGHVCGSSFNNN